MDKIDRKILNIIQRGFPLNERPYNIIGGKLGLSEDDVIVRIKRLYDEGIVRRIGGIFDTRKLGFESMLIAMKVPSEKIEKVANKINKLSGVTHNYERDGEYNLWFTIVGNSREEIDRMIEKIKKQTGITSLMKLPAIRIFKIDTNFSF